MVGKTSTAERIASYCSRGESEVDSHCARGDTKDDSHGMILAGFEVGAACPATCGFCP